jgi:protocatechuate 3,4-dioxygenase beta subunit
MKNFYPIRLLTIGFVISLLLLVNGCNDTPVNPTENQIFKGVLRDNFSQPIPNAVMEIVNTVSGKTGIMTEYIIERDTTDEDGNFAFAEVPSDMTGIDLRIIHPDLKPYQEKLETVVSSKNQTDAQVLAEYQDSCCGRVTFKVYNSKDSSILTGVEVRLNISSVVKRKGYTNDNGQITYYELCKNTYWVRLAKYGYNVVEKEGIKIDDCQESDYVEMSIYMTPYEKDSCCNGILKIEPVDSKTGELLKGATVKLRKSGTELSKQVIENSPVYFRELCKGEYQYVVIKEGYKAVETEITLGCNDTTEVKPQLEEIPCCDGVFKISVKDSLNNPIKEATISIWKSGTKLGYYYTNSDGIVTFTGICEGTYSFGITRTGYKSIEFQESIGCDDTVEISKTLQAVQKDSCCDNIVKIFVKNSKTNDQLNGATVKMFREGALQRSETVIEGVATFKEVCKGTYAFLIKKDGFEAMDFTVTVDCGQTYELTKSLNPVQEDSCCDGVAKVIIKDKNGNAIQNALIRLWKGSTVIREVKTGDNGTAELKELCKGSFAFSVNREGYKEIEWAVTFDCNDTVTYEKTLTAVEKDSCCDGVAKVVVKDYNGNALKSAVVRLWKGGTKLSEYYTESDGTITFRQLCEGSYAVSVNRDGYKGIEWAFTLDCNDTVTYEKSLTAVEQDTCCKAQIKLTVKDENGNALSSVGVKLTKSGTVVRSGTTSSDGYIAFNELCTGTYWLRIAQDGYKVQELEIKVECNKVYELSKTLAKATDSCCTAVMKILAIDSTETRINEARVEVYLKNKIIADGYTNSEGWWAADGLCSPATYVVVVKKDGYVTKEFTIKYTSCITQTSTAVLKKN